MATVNFENVRDVTPYYQYDPRVLVGLNSVPNCSYAHKANTIKSILESSDRIPVFIDDVRYWQSYGAVPGNGRVDLHHPPPAPAGPVPPQEVRIRLHTTRESITSLGRVNNFCFGTISQISLANALHQPGLQPYRTVHIELDAWYFENYPLGYCTGMLCHEFAVHHLGSYFLQEHAGALVEERNYYATGANAGQAFPYGPVPHVIPSAAGQPDHTCAAALGSPRHTVYKETILDVAMAMFAKIGAPAVPGQVNVRNQDVTDLFKCYLMDVASIQATNDHRAKGLLAPGDIVTCYQAHRLDLLALIGTEPGLAPLIALCPGPTTSATVLKEFGYLISSLAWSAGPTWSASPSGY
jgi:hypothetical protein